MKKLSMFVAGVVLMACATTKVMTSVPSQSDVDRVQDKFPGYTLTQLTDGKDLYEKNCGSCHELKRPASESESEWRRIVPDMVRKVNKKGKVLDQSGEDLILKYVVTMATAPKKNS